MSAPGERPSEASVAAFGGEGAPAGGMVRSVVSNAATRVFTVHLAPGEHLARHLAPGPLALLVTEGEIDLEVGDEQHHLRAGQCCLVVSGAEHALTGAGSGRSVTVGVLGVEDPREATDERDQSVVDLAGVLGDSAGRGVLWSLPRGSGVNLNLARLGAGESIDEHVNDLLDVVYVGIDGGGTIEVDGAARTVGPGQLTLVRAGEHRRLRARSAVFAYLTVHAERHGLSLRRRR